jgi:CRP/FNR family transcriptional regulator, anaerobic regulatory protein
MACGASDKKNINCLECGVRHNSLFKDLDNEEIVPAEAHINLQRHCKSGEYIINEQHQARSSYILASGCVILGTLLEDGSRQIFQLALPGDVIGFGVNKDNGYFAQAISDVKVCVMSNTSLDNLVKNHSAVAMRLIENLAKSNSSYQQYLLSLGRKDARQALAYLIMDVTERLKKQVPGYSLDKSEGCFFPLNQEDMADILGLTKVHVSRVISQFKKEDLIECRHKKLKVLNREKLRKIGSYTVSI